MEQTGLISTLVIVYYSMRYAKALYCSADIFMQSLHIN